MENLCCHLFFLYFKVNNVPIWERFIEFCCINFKFISQKSDLFLCKDSVVLMDKNKSFYEIPRDELLAGYEKQQEKLHNAEVQHQRSNSVEIER